MVERKYLKNYWSNIIIPLVVVIGGIAFFFHIVYKHSEKAMMVSDLDRVPITSFNVSKYKMARFYLLYSVGKCRIIFYIGGRR